MSYQTRHAMGRMPYPLRGLGRMPYPLRGLGDMGDERLRYGRTWELICFPAPEVRALLRVMKAWNDASPTLGDADHYNNFREDYNPVRGLKLLWIRMGKNDAWWPGAKSEHFNFGPTTYTDDCPGGNRTYIGSKPANTLRLDQEFWRELLARQTRVLRETTPATPYPASLWRNHSEGWVRLREDDPLLEAIRLNLVANGRLAPQDVISVKDDSRFVNGLKTYFTECERQNQLACGGWPQGINFGPNTATDEIRIHPTLLFRVLNTADPRAAAARERATSTLRTMRIKPPLFGGLPPVLPGGRRLDTAVTRSQMLPTPVRVASATATATVRAGTATPTALLQSLKGYLK